MKKILFLSLVMISASMTFAQSARTILVEEFTQASCPPCEATTPALNERLLINQGKLVQIRYQTSWPGVDPMNADNPGEVQTRVDYYGTSGVPDAWVDGISAPFPELVTQEDIDERYPLESPVLVTVSHELSADESTISVTVQVINEGTDMYDDSNDKLRVALIEELITWATPPGSTSITEFEAVLKTFFTTPAGIDVPAIAAGDMWEMTWTDLPMPSKIYDIDQIATVAFVQNDSNKEVVNAATTNPKPLLGDITDLSVTNSTTDAGGLCDTEITPIVEVVNEGQIDVENYSVNLLVNGDIVETINNPGTITAGSNLTVTFAPYNVPAGSTVISYSVENAEDNIAVLNNSSDRVNIGKAGSPIGEFKNDFETVPLGFAPEGMISNTPTGVFTVSADLLGLGQPIGGHGESAVSTRINYYQWNPATAGPTGFMIAGDQLIVQAANSALEFDYAFTTYQGSNDKMEVQISKDCGGTYTTEWEAAGSQLATASEVNNPQGGYTPSAGDWKTINVDLSGYVGETVLVRFLFTSGWGDMMYIDNINAKGVISAINDLDADEALTIYPNPVNDILNVEITTNSQSDVNLRVINNVGQIVKIENLTKNLNGSSTFTVNTSDLQTGIYTLYFLVGEKEVVKRIIVE